MNEVRIGLRSPGYALRRTGLGSILRRSSRLFFWIIPAAFYTATACRTPGWLDATMIASNVVDLSLGSWVNTHNLFHLLGHFWLKLFPPANIHFYLVLLCALLGALTVHFMYLVGLELTSSPVSAGIASLVLMVSHSLWWHSTTLEVYTLNTALMAVFLYLVIRFDKTRRVGHLLLASFFFGLGCSNHVLMGLFIFSFVALFLYMAIRDRRFPVRRLLLATLCFLLGIQLYLFVFVRDVRWNIRTAQSDSARASLVAGWRGFAATVDEATGTYFRKYMFTPDMPKDKRRFWRINYLVLQVLNFPSPALPLAYFGFFVFWRKPRFRLTFVFLVVGILAQAIWSANYFIWDMYAFSLPVYVLLAVPLTLAVHWLASGRGVRRAALLICLPAFLLPVLVYPRIPIWYRNGGIVRRYFDSYPEVAWTRHTFDAVEYVARPERSRYDKVDRYAESLFNILPYGAHFLSADSRADYPLRYYYRDIKHQRTDIVYHSVFIPLLTSEKARRVAVEIRQCIERGEPVYTASVEYPEKAVLDQLYLLYDSSKNDAALGALCSEEYLRSFPRVRFEKIVMVPQEEVWIYRMSARHAESTNPPIDMALDLNENGRNVSLRSRVRARGGGQS